MWESGQYVETAGAADPKDWEERKLHPNRPVSNVNHEEAAAYCAWSKCRLPKEEEWERAVCGTVARKNACGSEAPEEERLNLYGNFGGPSPVGVFPRGNTADGIEDMGGNGWEWTDSFHDKSKERLVLRGLVGQRP